MTISLLPIDQLPASPVADVRRRVTQLRAEGREVLDLTVGDLDLPTPPHVIEAAVQAARAGQTRYTDVTGTPELKDAVREHFRRQNGLVFGRSEIIVTNGSSQAIASALMVRLRAGGEVVIPDPSWQTYAGQVALAGGTAIPVRCAQNSGFKLSVEDLAAAINERTRWVIINNPVNPTGVLYSAEELAALCDVVAGHPHVWVLADNLYEFNVFDGHKATTPLQVAPHLRERAVTISGVAKGYSMTGWRIGFAGAPTGMIADMTRVQYLTTSCASSISQAAALAALTGPQDVVAEYAAILQNRRDRLVGLVNACPGLSCTPPAGTLYLPISCAGVIGRRRPGGQPVASGLDMADYLLEAAGVACLPGEGYAMPGYIRMSFSVPTDVLERAGALVEAACCQLTDGQLG